ncbi:MAG: phosphoribosylamine--glycine ligase family protein, partial [archaeon]|nr:phosphoribosylamine--glycine ligase family protein [archaeon]
MRIAVLGMGGREHALVWKLIQGKDVEKVYCIPGNAGTASIAENVPLEDKSFESIASFAKENKIDLTVIGPEAPLTRGIVDFFQEKGLKVF